MEVHSGLFSGLKNIHQEVQELEGLGYDGAYSAEINNEPFFPLMLAAEHSKKIQLSTSIAVAFARNPMQLATLAHDLNEFSEGRFTLGLGSQIKAHITRRYSMPWSKPAARMREFVLAMRAIWDCWENGSKLDFNGEFYTHTLMNHMFTPKKAEFATPKVNIAGVGPLMTQVSAEVADGLICHGFTTAKYLEEVTLPNVEKGLNKAGRKREDFKILCPVIIVAGETEEAFNNCKVMVKAQLAFYGSTPAYKGVLEQHGWGDLHDELLVLSKKNQWDVMAELIDDEFLNAFSVVAENASDIPQIVKNRYGHLIDVWMQTHQLTHAEQQQQLIKEIQAG